MLFYITRPDLFTGGRKQSKEEVGLLGFEPRQTESKSVVLPLHHNPIINWIAKIRFQAFSAKWILQLIFYRYNNKNRIVVKILLKMFTISLLHQLNPLIFTALVS